MRSLQQRQGKPRFEACCLSFAVFFVAAASRGIAAPGASASMASPAMASAQRDSDPGASARVDSVPSGAVCIAGLGAGLEGEVVGEASGAANVRNAAYEPVSGGESSRRMNFVFLLVDDLGWADLGIYGSRFHETPHIDELARSGLRFTQAYAACPVCSPTRASILTGRHPVRVDITDWIPGFSAAKKQNPRFLHVSDRDELALSEVTIAELLKSAGYRTFFAGKWHLGSKGHLPTDQGFDQNIGGFDRGSPPGGYYSPWRNPYLKAQHDGEYLTERLTDECELFLKEQSAEQPFLMYLSYYNVHTPIQPYRKRIRHYEEKAGRKFTEDVLPISERDGQSRSRQDNPAYASMVAAVDDSVGRLMDALRQNGLADNTAVFLFSDNGGLCTKPAPGPTCNLPLRAGKGWLYEGGIREPLIVRVPGVTDPDSLCDDPVFSTDLAPTIAELAGLSAQPELHSDGMSLLPLLRGDKFEGDRMLYWHYPHYHGSTWRPGAAIRRGPWKLIEFYEEGAVELYRLDRDPGEQNDLAGTEPEMLQHLREELLRWQRNMGARMPQPNPAWRPLVSEE